MLGTAARGCGPSRVPRVPKGPAGRGGRLPVASVHLLLWVVVASARSGWHCPDDVARDSNGCSDRDTSAIGPRGHHHLHSCHGECRRAAPLGPATGSGPRLAHAVTSLVSRGPGAGWVHTAHACSSGRLPQPGQARASGSAWPPARGLRAEASEASGRAPFSLHGAFGPHRTRSDRHSRRRGEQAWPGRTCVCSGSAGRRHAPSRGVALRAGPSQRARAPHGPCSCVSTARRPQ